MVETRLRTGLTMALRQLSCSCLDKITCPGVWEDDDCPEDVIAVGMLLDPPPVPLGPGERAIRLPRQVLRDARIV